MPEECASFLKDELHASTTSATPITCSYSRLTVNIDGLHARVTSNTANDLKKFAAHEKYTYDPKASDLTATGEVIYKLIGSSITNQPGNQGHLVSSSFTIIAQCPTSPLPPLYASTLKTVTASTEVLSISQPSPSTIISSADFQPATVAKEEILKTSTTSIVVPTASDKTPLKKPARSFSHDEKSPSTSSKPLPNLTKSRSNSSGPRLFSSLFNKSKNTPTKKEINHLQPNISRLNPLARCTTRRFLCTT
ncbi:MAG: hypothetical protein K0M45_11450 [Candidatus Paracaedibacteraceae bacterium]|nr:hypothetical protein [Candidatus Paracaedibacteraceae bacterium]